MVLKNLDKALEGIDILTLEQKDDIRQIFRALLSSFSVCVSVKYVRNVSPTIHDAYIEELRTRMKDVAERLYDSLSFTPHKYRFDVVDAVRLDIYEISQEAKLAPNLFSYHY